MNYTRLPENVVKAWPKLSPKAKAVAVAVASFMNRSGECWPGREAIKERSGVGCLYTVTQAIAELKEGGLVEVNPRPNKTSRYAWPESRVGLPSGKSSKSTFQNDVESRVGLPPESRVGLPSHNINKINLTTSRAKGAGGAPTDSGKPNVWGEFVDAWRETFPGKSDPVAQGPDTKAGKEIGKAIPDPERRKAILRAYLADQDSFLAKQGHALRLLPGRINAYTEGNVGDRKRRVIS